MATRVGYEQLSRDNMDRASQILAQGVPPGVLSTVMNSN
jgi:hypothetical protein